MSIDAIRQEVYELGNSEGEGLHRSEAIFRALSGIVADAGFLTNPQWSPMRFKWGKVQCSVDGYDIDEEDGLLTVFVLLDAHSELELDRSWPDVTLSKKELDRAIKELISAVTAIDSDEGPELEDSDPARELVKSLRGEYRRDQGRVVCCVLTTGKVTNIAADSVAGAAIRTSVWDSERLVRTRENGRETLIADFTPIGGLPCLISEREAQEIAEGRVGVIISKIPGSFLADLYNEFRMRLLEKNVRAFLQVTGKVNKGIRDTIHEEPEHFLCYNNGISTTASKVTLQRTLGGGYSLVSAEDFQIVNGGQTTASIARCVREDKIDVSSIGVAMKLTVVPEDQVEKLVPRISRFANTQNRIQETDFFANNPWHIQLERHSRATEAERDEASGGRPIRWYYERVRGQYADELAKCSTRPQKDAFKARHPARARFTKTDLARYLLAWEQEAHSVSLGGQKCFARLMTVLGATSANADSSQLPSEEDFRRICCLGILQRQGERICGELNIVGYRANLVAYAIMILSAKTAKRFPWRKIWLNQALPSEIDQALRIAIPGCDAAIRESAGKRNVTEWAKKSECREFVLSRAIELGLDIAADWDVFSIKDIARPKAEFDLLKVFEKVTPEQWIQIAKAVSRDGGNEVWSGVAMTMATKLLPSGRAPSEKQSKILRKALVKYRHLPSIREAITSADIAVLGG